MDAIFAKCPLALEAFDDRAGGAMIDTRRGAVGEGGGRGWLVDLELRYSDTSRFLACLFFFESQVRAAESQDLPGLERRFLNLLSVNISAIGRAEIAHQDRVFGHNNLAVETRYGGIVDPEIIGGVSTHSIESRLELEHSWMGQTC